MADTAVERVTARQQRENLSVLAGTAFLRGAHNSAYSVIWQPFVLSLGASMPVLGLLNSLGGMNGIVTTVVQPLGGWMADRFGRRPFLLASSLAILIGYALFALAGWSQLGMLLAIGVIFLGVSALAYPARSSMTAESVRAERHGSAFSLILVATTVPGIVAPTLGGYITDRLGYVAFFPFAIVLEGLALLLVLRYLHETRLRTRQRVRPREALSVVFRSVIPPRGLAGFFAATAGDSFSWGMGWGLLYGMAAETFHFSGEQLGLMSSVMSLTWAISQMPIGQYIDRHSTRGIMIFSEALGIPCILIWITQSRFEFFLLAQVLFALTAATWVPVVNTYLSRAVLAEERAEAFGRLNMFKGLISVPAPTIGGLLYAWGGMPLPMVANVLGVCVVIAILYFFVHETPANGVPA